ncbi:phage holin family protein [Gordonia desulfuricans]|uniref:Phage holin family protein n=1 Tax=Gordonia desulfuricans TaxID=89051 RepID=A0A7K3LV13_9ACTN|nr:MULTISPECIES: phage holin family protein [Gordonia]EMP14155.2 membrane protein [Gordonia sp. NB41Y]NDK91936.1 phage holin family protein [Gordonia desulfuricans]WLP89754.1 phage holin family protein [Gordonia sp. NB41Y]
MRAFVIRTAFTGLSLWIATLIVPGLHFVWDVHDATWQKVGIVFFVAVVFGVINAFVKPIVQILSIPLYILTLGLIHIIINALMIELTSWFTRNTTGWGLEVDSFWWSAVFGAIVISVVGWLIALVMKEPDVYQA